ncbi:MAG: apolipoprotein N-acyltransferase [bacterium]|nr:apolipoprotein N-acyltransferase [bacterium]
MPHTSGRRDWRPTPATNRLVLAGLVTSLGLPPYPWTGLLVIVGLALLFHELAVHPRPGRAAWIFGCVHQASLLYWLFLLDPAKSIPTPLLVPAQALAAMLYVSVFYLLMGWAWGRLRGRLGPGPALLLMPVAWTVMEHLRALGELGFPWCLSGAAVHGTPLTVFLRAAGELGLGTVLAFTAVALVTVVGRRHADIRRPALAAAAVAWLLVAGGSALRPSPPEAPTLPGERPVDLRTTPMTVAAVQADVALADKWNDAKIDSTKEPYALHTVLAAREGAEWVVWAETAIPAYVRFDAELLAWTRDVVQDAGVHLYMGFPDAERDPEGVVRRFNSSALLSPAGIFVGDYAKHHLLPIGETMPFQRWLPFLGGVDVGQAEWEPGPPPRPLVVRTPDGDFPFAGLICFESAFAWLARDAVRSGARCLAVITNDGWFGRSAGPRQHAALARLRAAECGVPVVRCANNGISFVCDDRGRDLDTLDLGRRGHVMGQVAPGSAATAFVRWGNIPLFFLLLLWTIYVMAARRERT